MSGYGAFARYYDLLTADVDYPRRARNLDRLIRKHFASAELLLDLACGTGSFSEQFARLGYDVTGVDASAEMLCAAMQKAAENPRRILFLQQDMRELDLYGTVDVAVCALDSLNHLPDEKSFARVLSRVSLFLNPGGVFLFDVNTAYKHRNVLAQNAFVYKTPQVYCVWCNSHDEAEDCVHISLDFFEPAGKNSYRRESEQFSERLFTDGYICAALEEAGLSLLEVYDGDCFEKPHPESQRLLYIAKKETNK